MDPSIQSLRLLDIDDLLLIKMLGEGVKGSHIARTLLISPAAVCHRIRKYERVWPGFFVKNPKSPKDKRVFYEGFEAVHKKVCNMLEVLDETDRNVGGVSSCGTAS